MDKISKIRELYNIELLSLIGKPVYAIRNYHKGDNYRNFYISTMAIKNIVLSPDGIWINTGFEIFHETELGSRFNLSKEEIQKTLVCVKTQQFNNISEIFEMRTVERSSLLNRY